MSKKLTIVTVLMLIWDIIDAIIAITVGTTLFCPSYSYGWYSSIYGMLMSSLQTGTGIIQNLLFYILRIIAVPAICQGPVSILLCGAFTENELFIAFFGTLILTLVVVDLVAVLTLKKRTKWQMILLGILTALFVGIITAIPFFIVGRRMQKKQMKDLSCQGG